jgi:hypothetical protein
VRAIATARVMKTGSRRSPRTFPWRLRARRATSLRRLEASQEQRRSPGRRSLPPCRGPHRSTDSDSLPSVRESESVTSRRGYTKADRRQRVAPSGDMVVQAGHSRSPDITRLVAVIAP